MKFVPRIDETEDGEKKTLCLSDNDYYEHNTD